MRRTARSGVKGVFEQEGKWRAYVAVPGGRRYLGYFGTKEAASAAYLSAAKEAYGEFARAA